MAPDESDTTQPYATREERIDNALALIREYGDIDGAHHKQWVIDRLLRALCESDDHYEAWTSAYEINGMREWDAGVAP